MALASIGRKLASKCFRDGQVPPEVPPVHREITVISCFLVTLAICGASAQVRSAAAYDGKAVVPSPPREAQAVDLNTIVANLDRAQRANPARFRSYATTREYQLFSGDERQPGSAAVVRVNFYPPNVKNFVIERSSGNGRAEKVARKILQHESDAARETQPPTLLDQQNYNFTYLGTATITGHPCYLLGLEPRRKDKDLISGRAYVDAQSYMPRLVDGELAKSPSWWLKGVHVRLSFVQVDGMWLQESTKAVADVRFLGPHTLLSRSIEVEPAQVEATGRSKAGAPGTTRNHRRPATLLGSGVLISR
jgi:hypothetical protein